MLVQRIKKKTNCPTYVLNSFISQLVVLNRDKKEENQMIQKTLLLTITLLFLNPSTVQATDTPMLRLNTEMHTATITRIDVDAAERYLVTGSNDKTVRVWSLPEGRLLRVLRPPMGDGDEGKIYAVAISEDGETVAAGGWTKGEWTKSGNHKIYLFNRATGELRQRITGHPNVIFHLAYSPDGRYLVASLGGQNGIRVYRTTDYRLQAKDTDYGNSSYCAEFDAQGRLVTSSDDGYIRLYDNRFNLLKKNKAQGGNLPYAVRFSPSGDKIAVGFDDSTQVNVLSGKNLRLLYRPDTQGVDNGDVSTVAWSQDGRWLYAGGKSSAILRWSQAGWGSYRAWSASYQTIMDIRALRYGEIVFGAADPAFGLFDAKGQKTLYREAGIADFRDNYEGFLVSREGSTVQFGYEVWGKRPARFSLNERTLTLNPATQSNLNAPRTQGLNITDWKHNYHPKLNGRAISLEQYEMARSLAIAPDNQHFLLGADWSLRYFDKQGHQQWRVPVPGVAWGVNIAGNGKVAVAAFGDGTLRWYRLRDGKELLAFFPHKDGQRWIVWTPQGYYAAASGAESLIGWHLNNGQNQAADFYPAARFRVRYYRPDVIAKVLDTLSPEQALQLANQEKPRPPRFQPSIDKILPPIVTLVSPQDGDEFSRTKVELRYFITSDSPITDLKVLIDGRPAERSRLVSPDLVSDQTQSIWITIPRRDVAISLIAENRYAASEPATVRLRRHGVFCRTWLQRHRWSLLFCAEQFQGETAQTHRSPLL
jgi:WD40 repeat protein